MKKSNRIHSYFAYILCFLLASCSLEEQILDESTGAELIEQEDIELNLIAPAYGSLTRIVGCCGLFALNEVTSDEMIVPARGLDWFDNGAWIRLHEHSLTPLHGTLLGAWNQMEGSIGTANTGLFLLMDRPNALSTSELRSFQAELRFLRAYFRYQLLDLFRQVPMRDEMDQDFSKPPPVFSGPEAYDWLVAELESIIPDLKEYGQITYGRVSKQTAYTLLAKLHLNAEVYTGTPKWEEAMEACNAVINSGHFKLADDYFKLFSYDNDTQNPEAILVVRQSLETQNRGVMSASMTLHYNQNLGMGKFTLNGFSTVEDFVSRWDEDNDASNGISTQDSRYQDERIRESTGTNLGFLEGPQVHPDGSPIEDSQLTGQTGNFVQLDYTPNISSLINANQHEGVRVMKFEPDPQSNPFLLGRNDFILFRYADIWLMKAEALFRLGQSEGLDMVNTLREVRGATALTSLTSQALLDERGFELYWEGHRRQDLIRFGQFTAGTWAFKDVSEDYRNVFPIPQQLLNVNQNLVQNPGY